MTRAQENKNPLNVKGNIPWRGMVKVDAACQLQLLHWNR